MAAPSYTEDLTDIDLAESTTDWATVNYSGGGGAALDFGPDLAMQGVNCVLRQVSGHERGALYQSPTIVSTANSHIFQWVFVANPGLTANIQNRGVCVIASNATNNSVRFHVDGNDTFGASGRVGKCYAYKYVTTANTSPPYRTIEGTPGSASSLFFFGASLNISSTAKGLNLGVDAVRHGTGGYITAGDGTTPATFDGFATVNDYNDATNGYNRWGILSKVGVGYELQGRLVFGQDNSKTPTACTSIDSDRSISFVDTIHAEADFTQVIVDHASTVIDWSNINFTALGTTNPGRFVVNNASTSVDIVGGVWTGIGITTLRAGCTIDGLTWRESGQITQNGATISNAIIALSSNASALLSDNPGLISGVRFIGDGTGHGIEIDTPGTYTFSANIFESGYSTTSPGSNPTPSTGSTDAMVYNNSGGLVTLNITDSGTTPTVRNAASSTTVVNNNTSVTFTGMKDNTEVRVYNASTGAEVAGIENATAGTVDNRSFNFSAASGLSVNYVLHNWSASAPDYESIRVNGYVIPGTATSIAVQQRIDRNSV